MPAVIPQRPSTAVAEAIEITWPSALGSFYQVQSSPDQTNWSDEGEPIQGDGTTLARFFGRNDGPPLSYRVVIADLSQ